MREAILHHIWKTGRFDHQNLKTTTGIPVSIINKGFHNHDAGPDFMNAKIKIDSTLWAGHVEMHIKASDWIKHKHQNDKAYNNVILHVVMDADKDIQNQQGQSIPTLALRTHIEESHLEKHDQLLSSLSWIPCERLFDTEAKTKLPLFKESLLIKRLYRKYSDIRSLLDQTSQNWEEVLYRMVLRYMGMKVNGEAFIMLSEKMPLKLILKCESVFEKESILFGQAGLLNGRDEYFQKLSKEYIHLKSKYGLTPMTGVEWKFARLRPANFPTIRISQIASLYQAHPSLFNDTIHAEDIKEIRARLDLFASQYWDTHYLPEKVSTFRQKKIGKAMQDSLLINVFIPLIYAYGEFTQNELFRERAVSFLELVKAENNSIIRRWKELEIKSKSAADSQALIELKTNLCDAHKCLDCQIGQHIIFGNKPT